MFINTQREIFEFIYRKCVIWVPECPENWRSALLSGPRNDTTSQLIWDINNSENMRRLGIEKVNAPIHNLEDIFHVQFQFFICFRFISYSMYGNRWLENIS